MTLTTSWTIGIDKRTNSTEKTFSLHQLIGAWSTALLGQSTKVCDCLFLQEERVAVLSSIPETALDEISGWILPSILTVRPKGWHCAAHYSPLAMYRWPENLTHSTLRTLRISLCSKSSLKRTIRVSELKQKWIFGSVFMISFACCPLLPAKPLAQVWCSWRKFG